MGKLSQMTKKVIAGLIAAITFLVSTVGHLYSESRNTTLEMRADIKELRVSSLECAEDRSFLRGQLEMVSNRVGVPFDTGQTVDKNLRFGGRFKGFATVKR